MSDWSSDGRFVAGSVLEAEKKTKFDIWIYDVREGTGSMFLQTEFNDLPLQRKADGRGPDARDTVEAGIPKVLFELRAKGALPYSVTPDGQRFLINTPINEEVSAPLTLLQNWAAELPR